MHEDPAAPSADTEVLNVGILGDPGATHGKYPKVPAGTFHRLRLCRNEVSEAQHYENTREGSGHESHEIRR